MVLLSCQIRICNKKIVLETRKYMGGGGLTVLKKNTKFIGGNLIDCVQQTKKNKPKAATWVLLNIGLLKKSKYENPVS